MANDKMRLNPEVVSEFLGNPLTDPHLPTLDDIEKISVLKQALDVLSSLNSTGNLYKEFAAVVLKQFDPAKPAGTALCDAMMRLWPSVAFEAVALRMNNGVREVYLRQRAMDDTAYPGEWHAPGSIYRHAERDRDVANRLEKEFGVPIVAFDYIDKHTTDEQRGTIHSMIFDVELGGDPRIDDRHRWFPVNDMPSNTVSFHKELYIPLVVKWL